MICRKRKKTASKIFQRDNKECILYSSVHALDKEIWRPLAGLNHFLYPEYLQALESSALAGFSFRYAILFEKKNPVAAYCFQLADLSSKDAGSIINMHQYGYVLQAIASGINDLLLRGKKYAGNFLITCGNMLVTGQHGIGCKPEHLRMAVESLPEIIDSLTQEIEKSKGRVVAVLVKDFGKEESEAASLLKKHGFHPLRIDPNMKLTLRPEWKTFDDYRQSLSAKYRLRVNNTMELTNGLMIKEFGIEEIEKHAQEIESLYNQVVSKAPVLIVRANASFFIAMKKKLKEHYRFRAIFKNRELIAFTTGYYYHVLDAHFIGIEYRLCKEIPIYQFILYDFIACAISQRKPELNYGRTAVEIKSTVGAFPVEMVAYLKINSPVLHHVAGAVLPFFRNDKYVIRNPFRQLKD